ADGQAAPRRTALASRIPRCARLTAGAGSRWCSARRGPDESGRREDRGGWRLVQRAKPALLPAAPVRDRRGGQSAWAGGYRRAPVAERREPAPLKRAPVTARSSCTPRAPTICP